MCKRQIIYVDASGYDRNTKYKISLFDKSNNKSFVMDIKEQSSSNIAEQYAVLNAIMYCVKMNIRNPHILCDNQSCSSSKIIKKVAKIANIAISWIPREINEIADQLAKETPNVSNKEYEILNLLYLSMKS
jgi:ribonuclease HI